MKKYLIAISIFIFYCSCQNNKSKDGIAMNDKYVEDFDNNIIKDSLIKKVITKGDTESYDKLFEIYNLSGHEKEWCYYAYIMANDFDYGEADLDLYYILRKNPESDVKTNKLANYYLLKAYEKGIKSAAFEVQERFDKSMPVPTADDYLKGIYNNR